jgi:hypothetical protein
MPTVNEVPCRLEPVTMDPFMETLAAPMRGFVGLQPCAPPSRSAGRARAGRRAGAPRAFTRAGLQASHGPIRLISRSLAVNGRAAAADASEERSLTRDG